MKRQYLIRQAILIFSIAIVSAIHANQNEIDISKKYLDISYIKKTKWGMDKDQVIKAYDLKYEDEKYYGISQEIDFAIDEYDITIRNNCTYKFRFNKLCSVDYMYNLFAIAEATGSTFDKCNYIGFINILRNSLTKEYGKPQKDEITWKNNTYISDEAKLNDAFIKGDIDYYLEWKTQNIIIQVWNEEIAANIYIVHVEATSFEYYNSNISKVVTACSNINQKQKDAISPQEIAKRIKDVLVIININNKKGDTISQGSGFLISNNLILTNLHVLKYGYSGFVKVLNEGIKYNIDKIHAIDPINDLCVFSIQGKVLSYIQSCVADARNVVIADEIYVGGNPMGLEGTISKGIVSAIRNDEGLIQIDAPISPGSSGGPIFNKNGEIIGIAVSSLISGQNLNFAIPTKKIFSMSSEWQLSVQQASMIAIRDRDIEYLKGNVKSIAEREIEYDYNSNLGEYYEKNNYVTCIMKFDERGNYLDKKQYSPKNGKLGYSINYEYSDKGVLEKSILIDLEGEKSERKYDYNEAIIHRISSSKSGDIDAKIRKKDDFGNTIEFGVGNGRLTYEYDKDKNPIAGKEYDDDKLLRLDIYKYEYDTNGNWTKQMRMFRNASSQSSEYHPAGMKIREILYY